MKKYLQISIIAMLSITSCKSKHDDPLPSYDYSHTYLPLNVGDTWDYMHNNDVKDTIESTVGRESYLVNGYGYSYVISSSGHAYYAQIGNMYYMIVENQDVDIPVPVLDESGFSFSETDTSTNVLTASPRIRTTLTTKEFNVSKTVNGKTYDNVIHTRVDLEFPDNGLRSPENYDFYFAKEVGIIEIDKGIFGFIDDTQTLLSFTHDPNTTLVHPEKTPPEKFINH
jgi:hypothetical protein